MPRPGLSVGVIYGGRSVEHDVSILTALQAMQALSERHRPVPIYVDREGRWRSGAELLDVEVYSDGRALEAMQVRLDADSRTLVPVSASTRSRPFSRRNRRVAGSLDVIVPAMHGTYGEDGSLQGLLEWVGLPYVGSGVGPSAAAMDKAFSKALLKEAGVPVVEYVVLERDPVDAPDDHVRRALSAIDLPVYVKPLSLGSSIGVSRCADTEAMRAALSLAFELDVAAIVEPSVEDAVEVNCAVLGRAGRACEPSVCEQPIRSDEFLSFDDKYARGLKGEGMKGAQRLIPAPIGEELTRTIQDLAVRAFSALGCAGVARVDLLIATTGEVCVNEVNTIPGSFSFYLWEPTGLSFPDLLDRLLDLAFEAERERAKTTRVFPTNLLLRSPGGAKAQVPTG